MKSYIRENVLGIFVKITKEFQKLDEMNDARERIKANKCAFEIFLTIIFMRGLDKRKYRELIHDFYIQYGIQYYQRPNRLQETVDIRSKVKFEA